MAAFWFYELESSSIESLKPHFEKTLCDRSPAVMGATLNVYLKLAEASTSTFKQQLLGTWKNRRIRSYLLSFQPTFSIGLVL